MLYKWYLLCLLSLCVIKGASAQQLKGGAFQIQNKATGLLLRPMDANGEDGTPIVVYPKFAWRCLTWDLLPAASPAVFTLKNYFTSKTFEAAGVKENTPLLETGIQQGASSQQWHFEKGEGDYYKISAP